MPSSTKENKENKRTKHHKPEEGERKSKKSKPLEETETNSDPKASESPKTTKTTTTTTTASSTTTDNEKRQKERSASHEDVAKEERESVSLPARPNVRGREARSLNRLQSELEEARASVRQLTEDYTRLRDYRETEPETALRELIAASDDRFEACRQNLAEYKQEIEMLKHENTALRNGEPALERQTQSQVDQERKEWQDKEKALNEQLESLQKELAAETEHSKDLNTQLKNAQSQIQAKPAPTTTTEPVPAPTISHVDKEMKTKLELSEELTGLLVRAVKEETVGTIYSCLIMDIRGKGRSFQFKLTYHPDSSCSYEPIYELPRDKDVVDILDTRLHNYMRMDKLQVVRVFRLLWGNINNVSVQ